MTDILLPATSAEDWRQHLADPIKHWATGFSAKTLAYCWQEAAGFPRSVAAVFERAGKPFADLEPLLILPEHKVPLPGGRAASQSDIWVLARGGDEMVSIAVEGKVDEPFDKTIHEWFAEDTPGKSSRFRFLLEKLGRDIPRNSGVRYQLIHRTVSAIVEAERFRAEHAMLLVHSFSRMHAWFGDFEAFLELWGIRAEPNTVHSTRLPSGLGLHFAWVKGEEQFLGR